MTRSSVPYARREAHPVVVAGAVDVSEPKAGEEWRILPRCPNYAVSSLGRVMRIAGGKGARIGRVLRQFHHSAGYWQVTLHDRGQSAALVHQLVCEAFHGPRPTPEHEVAHEDGCRTNARASNLSWKTCAGNKADMLRHGTARLGEKNNLTKFSADVVRAVRSATGSCREIGLRFGMSPQNVNRIQRRELWGHL
jgi:hypothetical protein